VFKAWSMKQSVVCDQVLDGINQLHAHKYAHCDICVDNVWVDRDGSGKVFIGDLEYCRGLDETPPLGIKRGDTRATTAGQLDMFQYQKFVEELAAL
jgi:serine/threonine protein kinase